MKQKLIKGIAYVIVLASIIGATVLLTKQAEPVVVVNESEPNIDEVIQLRAEEWLTTPEAFQYAKDKVTNELVAELSKI